MKIRRAPLKIKKNALDLSAINKFQIMKVNTFSFSLISTEPELAGHVNKVRSLNIHQHLFFLPIRNRSAAQMTADNRQI